MPTQTVPCPRENVVIGPATVVETQYRRNGAVKPLTLYVLATAVVRGQARLLCTTDPADVSDERIFLAYADSCSKLADRTTVTDWADISVAEIAGVLENLYFFDRFSSAYRQVSHVDTSDQNELIEAEQGYGGIPFGDIQTESVLVSLIQTQ